MQPYFLPYIGYFQLIAAVDLFIVYDNIKYTKKGWINRNRLLRNGADSVFSLPLKAAPDHLDVRERRLAEGFRPDKLLNQFKEAYRRAPYFDQAFPMLEEILGFGDPNLFAFLRHSIQKTCGYLGIATEIRTSSDIGIDHGLRGQEKVIALCEAVGATIYVNPIGGTELYGREAFQTRGIDLRFLRALPGDYVQFENDFVPWLSIIDLMMFNSVNDLKTRWLVQFELT